MPTDRTIKTLSAFLQMFLAPFWIPIQVLRHRGHALDGMVRARLALTTETWLNDLAQRSGMQRVNPFKEFPGCAEKPTFLNAEHWGSLHDRVEYPLLTAIIATLQPRLVFEFGTFHGAATLLFARACPEAQITTLNIPSSQSPRLGILTDQQRELIATDEIGAFFRGKPEAARIHQLLLDSSDLDVSGHRQRYDFVWVDAGHSYECVCNDSDKAFEMVRPGGYVFWHDFDPLQEGLARALFERAPRRKLCWIERTSLVYWRAP